MREGASGVLQNFLEFLIYISNDFFELARTSYWKIKIVELSSVQNKIKNFLELWNWLHMVFRLGYDNGPIYPGIEK